MHCVTMLVPRGMTRCGMGRLGPEAGSTGACAPPPRGALGAGLGRPSPRAPEGGRGAGGRLEGREAAPGGGAGGDPGARLPGSRSSPSAPHWGRDWRYGSFCSARAKTRPAVASGAPVGRGVEGGLMVKAEDRLIVVTSGAPVGRGVEGLLRAGRATGMGRRRRGEDALEVTAADADDAAHPGGRERPLGDPAPHGAERDADEARDLLRGEVVPGRHLLAAHDSGRYRMAGILGSQRGRRITP